MIAVALAAFFLVHLIRSFRWIKVKMIDGVKPFACDLCMSFWCSVAAGGWRVRVPEDALQVAAAAGLCLLVLKVLGRIPEPFPEKLDDPEGG